MKEASNLHEMSQKTFKERKIDACVSSCLPSPGGWNIDMKPGVEQPPWTMKWTWERKPRTEELWSDTRAVTMQHHPGLGLSWLWARNKLPRYLSDCNLRFIVYGSNPHYYKDFDGATPAAWLKWQVCKWHKILINKNRRVRIEWGLHASTCYFKEPSPNQRLAIHSLHDLGQVTSPWASVPSESYKMGSETMPSSYAIVILSGWDNA